jgi:hypothetical protein
MLKEGCLVQHSNHAIGGPIPSPAIFSEKKGFKQLATSCVTSISKLLQEWELLQDCLPIGEEVRMTPVNVPLIGYKDPIFRSVLYA